MLSRGLHLTADFFGFLQKKFYNRIKRMMAESIQDPVVQKYIFMWYSNNQEFKSRLVRNVKDIGMHVQISQ